MAAITAKQFLALTENAPGNLDITAVRSAKQLVADRQRALSRFIDTVRTAKGQPTQEDYMLLVS
jgi:hypothetical protein